MTFTKKMMSATAALALTAGAAFADAHSMNHMNNMVGGAEMFADKNIVENAVNSADHTTLVAAVKAAGLVDTLSGPGPFTVSTTAAAPPSPRWEAASLPRPSPTRVKFSSRTRMTMVRWCRSRTSSNPMV